MSACIIIDDDGDETVFIRIDEEIVIEVNHDEFGWAGMETVIAGVVAIADAFGLPITNHQEIV